MNSNQSFSPGSFIKPHGLKGQLKVHVVPPGHEVLPKVDAIFVEIAHQLVPYVVESFSLLGSMATIKLKGIDTIEDAEKFRNKEILLPLDLIKNIPTAIDFKDLINFKVIDKLKGEIGSISQITESKFQAVMHIQASGTEILIPFSEEIVQKINHKTQTIHIHAPEGLIDLYLD